MMKRILLTLATLLALGGSASAQITIPNTLQAGAVIRAAELNTNFDTLGTKSLNRVTGGTIEGNITVTNNITIDGVDISDFLIVTGEIRANAAGTASAPAFSKSDDTNTGFYFPDADEIAAALGGTQRFLLDANGLTVFGVNLINSSGKIPSLTSTYFASLDGSDLTDLNASALASGTVADARLSSNIPLLDNENTFTVSGTPLTVAPSSAPAEDTLLLDIQDDTETVFSVDYEGDIVGSSATLATLQITGGTPDTGKVLTSDASGNATWEDAGVASGAVPSGLIALFDDACPVSWTRVSAWDDKFVRGGETYDGVGGGSDTHTHAVDPPSTESTSAGSHTHSVDPASVNTSSDGSHTHDVSGTTGSGGSHSHTGTTASGGSHTHSLNTTLTEAQSGTGATVPFSPTASGGSHTHTFTTSTASTHTHSFSDTSSSNGSHNHSVNVASTTSSSDGSHTHDTDIASFSSAAGDTLPAYVTVVFCKKD